ncbi:hypothetical protein BC833DRAFT_620539 [Globomyces pollinis-pini]|nr:hypothetical protein BC833DRAFT_620539 [Globomyces pollinis-pini]
MRVHQTFNIPNSNPIQLNPEYNDTLKDKLPYNDYNVMLNNLNLMLCAFQENPFRSYLAYILILPFLAAALTLYFVLPAFNQYLIQASFSILIIFCILYTLQAYLINRYYKSIITASIEFLLPLNTEWNDKGLTFTFKSISSNSSLQCWVLEIVIDDDEKLGIDLTDDSNTINDLQVNG